MKTINGQNYFNERSFAEMCKELEAGEHISVYIDCIGHTRNNTEQEIYKEQLTEKFGDRLEVVCQAGVHVYHYEYKLKA